MFHSIPLPKDAELPETIRKTLRSLPAINVFRMLANVPQSFPPFVQLARSLLGEGKFNPRLREIAILRQAHLIESTYEWHQHAFLSRNNGVTDHEMEIIKQENPVKSLGEEENFLCRVSDEITMHAKLTDETFQELFKRYSVPLGSELILCLSYFNMLGRFINCTRVKIEEDNPLESLSSPTN